ncbi:hypothetical protein GQF61_13660 [Sphingobacterium sp. DK4209]|uniref:Membrane or secreted protein n=1 Tax=Sphingobacterium zhuxiongii TaxID=2662364 RepID=A0A5Q0Q649_9SPHI|nr:MULTISPECIES: hypothetical protein [unclassified Sphingobacterium]MVZ66903.1 hypothetical protein [Sphingobacterium sp. DK4209]QGA25545.1 hypothetical protein GFH32_04080 [Sphingobacterium sp. dk4302]
MKRILSILLTIFLTTAMYAQETTAIAGAYLAKDGQTNHLILLIDGYSSYIKYENNKYLSTWGGPYATSSKLLTVKVEYSDANPSEVGTSKNLDLKNVGSDLQIGDLLFKKQNSNHQALDGLWRITGRQQENKLSTIARGDRKTIKLLVDGYFQWIAINPAERGFYGTGGGRYSFKDGDYVEEIVFFSRDNSRVGATLEFKGELKEKDWHHSGKSSKGDPIYEIWSLDAR